MIAGDLLNSQVKGINLVFPSDIYESRDYLDGINKQEQQESVNIAFWGFYYTCTTDADGSTQQMKT